MVDIRARREQLIQALKDSDEEVRAAAADALESLEGCDHLDALIAVYREGDHVTRVRVLYALGRVRDERAATPLTHALTSPEEDVRSTAVRVLGERGDPRTVPHLLKALNDQSVTIRTLAVEALGNFKDPRVIAPLKLLLESDNVYLVVAAIEALGKIGHSSAEESLLKALSHTAPEVRRAAAHAVGQLGL